MTRDLADEDVSPAALNALGSDGWELVAVVPAELETGLNKAHTKAVEGNVAAVARWAFVFKRPVE